MAHARTQSGFTLLELLLVITIISLAAGGTVALDRSVSSDRNVQSGGEAAAGAIRQAQTRAAAMSNDDAWSVHIDSESVTVFEGTDFSGRDAGEDRVTSFAAPLTVIGTTDIVFAKGSMVPVAAASTSLESGRWRWVVRVNAEGLIHHGAR